MKYINIMYLLNIKLESVRCGFSEMFILIVKQSERSALI